VNEVTCKTCGATIENKTRRVNPRQFCNSSCRNKYWNAGRRGREEYKPKPKPKKISNWELIMSRVDPITHRYTNAPELPEIKREVR